MRCAVWIGGGEFRIEDRPSVEPGPHEVRLAVHACGVCLTEVHGIDGLIPLGHPPLVLGHEFGGIVDAVGPGDVHVQLGAHVVGLGSGGFAEQVVLAADRVFVLPTGVPLEHAALLEPLVACAAAVRDAHLPFGSSVLVTGAGPMGLLLVQLVRRGGAARVLISEPDVKRRELALRFGAERATDPRAFSLAEAVRDFTAGRGVDAAFETVGQPNALADCLEATAERGQVIVVGVNTPSTSFPLDLYKFHPRNLTLRWSWGPAGFGDFARGVPAAMPWLQQLHLEELISHRVQLDQIALGFEIARGRKGLKVLVLPDSRCSANPSNKRMRDSEECA